MIGFLKRLFRLEEAGPPAAGRALRGAVRDRRQAEDRLRSSEEQFRQLVAGVRDYAIFLLDAQGRVTSWNAGAERLKGYRAEEIVGRHFSVFYPEEAVRRRWPWDELRLAEEAGRFEDEGWRLRKDGSRFWANVVITALRNDDGRLRGFLKITRDLTERKQAEDALRLSEQRFRLLVEDVEGYAVFLLDPDGHVTTWNAGAARMKGYRAEEIVGRHFSVFYPEEAVQAGLPQQALRQAQEQGRFEAEGWRVRKDGSRFWANVVLTALRDEAGRLRGFSKVTRDLTERRQAQDELEERVRERTAELSRANEALRAEAEARRALAAELQRRVAQLAEADRHKNEFLAMLSHELRNPLAPLRNGLHLLKMPGLDVGMTRQTVQMMDRQLQQLVRLVDDLLDVARIVRGKIELRREPVELATVVGRAVETAQPALDARGHELTVTLPSGPVLLHADPVRLAQALANLLGNAAKYTEQPGRIRLSAQRSGSEVLVRVSDSGVGIAPELLPRIFDLFVQAEQSLARSQGGLGIGLTLVKHVAELHGGTVEAHSEGPGRGSEFVLRLPALPGGRAEGARAEQPAEAAPAGEAPRRVLVVDDNIDAAESAAALLRRRGHTVRTVHDGASVLAAVRDFRPEVLLLDLGLPDMTGYEVARQLRGAPGLGDLVLAALTGYGHEDARRRCREAGFDLHLTKPLDPDQLHALVGAVHGPLAG
jgi:PAS domain S-box-containing protein